MKNILIVAYYYPPKGGAGVQRTAKFAKYLQRYGYNVHVLTVKENASGVTDLSLNFDVENGIKIYRTEIKETKLLNRVLNVINKNKSEKQNDNMDEERVEVKPNYLKTVLRNIAKKMFLQAYNLMYIPDDKKGWIDFAVEKGREIISNNNIDIIFTTSLPYSSHMIGYKLAKEFNVKWIVDFRDPWVTNALAEYTFLVKQIYKYLEKKIIKRADRVISVSQPIIDDFISRYKDEKPSKFKVITNGYDEEDFDGLNLKLSEANDKFTILYNGSLYANESPKSFFVSIKNLIEDGKIDRNKIKVKFVGDMGKVQSDLYNIYKSIFPEVYEFQTYKPHKESLLEICYANALLLILGEGKGTKGVYSGKIFEYIRAEKPIIGIVPDGVARELIEETNTGYVAYPSKQKEVEEIIYKLYNDFINKQNRYAPLKEKIENYSRENLTKKLIRIMQELCD